MAKASKQGAAPTPQVSPDSANASFFFDASALAALLGRAGDPPAQAVDDLSLFLVQREGEDRGPSTVSVPVDQQLLTQLLEGATLSIVENVPANGGNSDGHGCDHGSLMIIEGTNGIPFLPLLFEGAVPVTKALDQEIMERLDCLMPDRTDELFGVFATTDEHDALLILVVPPLDPPPAATDFG